MRDVSCLLSCQKPHAITRAKTTQHFGLKWPSKRNKNKKKTPKTQEDNNMAAKNISTRMPVFPEEKLGF